MTKLLQWSTVRLTRRRFLNRVTTLTFGLFAGLAAGAPQIAYAGGCSGIACAPCNCNGPYCKACGSTSCSGCSGCCPNDKRCWATSNGHTCCDCSCRSGSFGYECYCHAR
jgi:hypothetical protein